MNHYHLSVIELFKKLKGKPFFFTTDTECYENIKPHIVPWDLCKINIVDFSKTETNNYYTQFNNFSGCEKSIYGQSIEDKKAFLLIWHYKFELLFDAYKYAESMNIEYVCYLDGGCCRPDRIKYWQHFFDNDFVIKKQNKIHVNYTEINMNKTICLKRLCDYGNYEIACNHMFFSTDFIPKLNDLYFKTVDLCLEQGFITTEQRVFTILLRKLYKEDHSIFTFSQKNGNTYLCAFGYE